jgi:hypothetical protein
MSFNKRSWIFCYGILALAAAGCSSVSISADFEGGSLGKIEKISDTEFRCAVAGQADHEGRNRQASWYHFRVDGAKGREITVTLTDLKGEYNYKPAPACIRGDTPPLVTGDGSTWRHLDHIEIHGDEATIRFTPDSDQFWVSHLEPYTASRLDRYLAQIAGSAHLKDYVFGKSVEGRDLHVLTITEVAPSNSSARTVWLMCRQHAWETGTSFVAEGAIRWLLSDSAAPYRRQLVFRILPMMDPDGCAHGGVRFNRNGYDLNRNWDTADPDNPESRRLMPEICAAKKILVSFKDLFLTLHNQETGEWMSGSERHKEVADRLFAALKGRTTFDPSEQGPRPPVEKIDRGRYSVYEYLDRERDMPAFLLEQGITVGRKLGHLPTADDRREFGGQLIKVLADVALGK